MRSIALLLLGIAAVGCSNEADDGSVTNGDNEIVQEQTIEKELKPGIAAPETPIIGKEMSVVLTEMTAGMTAGATERGKDGCSLIRYKKDGKVAAERETCESAEIIHTVDSNGNVKTEYSDRNKDGKVDRFTGLDKTVVQYVDANFDGKVDTVIEKVDLIKDFSLKGYDPEYSDTPKSKFAFRVRDDRDRDGKFDVERYVAKGPLTR